MADPYRNHHVMFEHPFHNVNRAQPIRPMPCVEIVARGVVVAKVYPARGESREEMRARAERMARGYSGEIREVVHAP